MRGNEVINLGNVNCACGCGQPASQFYKGIPIPIVNPATHYRTYISKEKGEFRRLREGMILGDSYRVGLEALQVQDGAI